MDASAEARPPAPAAAHVPVMLDRVLALLAPALLRSESRRPMGRCPSRSRSSSMPRWAWVATPRRC